MTIRVDVSTCTSLGPCRPLAVYLRDGVAFRDYGMVYLGHIRLKDCPCCGLPIGVAVQATWDWKALRPTPDP